MLRQLEQEPPGPGGRRCKDAGAGSPCLRAADVGPGPGGALSGTCPHTAGLAHPLASTLVPE